MSSCQDLYELSEKMTALNDKVESLVELLRKVIDEMAKLNSTITKGPQNRTRGYVNWTDSHDALKTQKWVRLSTIKDAFNYKMRCDVNKRDIINDILNHSNRYNSFVVNEETRFRQDETYVNVNCPQVKEQFTSLKLCLEMRSKFPEFEVGNYKDAVHNYSSFEIKYQLKWL